MKIYKGINALSPFRQKLLLQKLQAIDKNITGVSAEYLHFVNTDSLDNREDKILKRLLTYGDGYKSNSKGQSLIVIPRLGTISPWSTKATDIAHNTGLKKVERIERGIAYYIDSSRPLDIPTIAPLLHDRMIESVLNDPKEAEDLFNNLKPKPFAEVNIGQDGIEKLRHINNDLGLALSEDELQYLYNSYRELDRNPSDVELMMFSVVNSEHCRHKIFNARWVIDGKDEDKSLFKKIKNTYEHHSGDILSAYSDNAAVLRGATVDRFYPAGDAHKYEVTHEPAHLVVKVETHNHPTAVAPVPGAATGIGGEIRDEAATGRGAKTKMGLSGFSVSNLELPGYSQPWEKTCGKPNRIASALDIMLEAPIGGAAFSNEFGRPNLAGYFRTYEQADGRQIWGYHKPIMLAGGLGNIKDEHVVKKDLPVGALVIVLGGPAMLIGLGGGTASSVASGESAEMLDFASVQRANAEMQRRAQEVINQCWAQADANPILTIHDVGAGGLSNALPELVHDSGLGARFELRKVPNAEPGMSPMEIWSNEAQERYVLGIEEKDLGLLQKICERERCPFSVVGKTTKKEQLTIYDEKFDNNPVDIPMSLLFGNAPRMVRSFERHKKALEKIDISGIDIHEAVSRVLQAPAVASKKFLITIGDRSVGGLTVRDQMVGPWQVPVSDVAVTASSFGSQTGEAMAIGERAPLAMINPAASARMAVAEAITNIAAAPIEKLSDVKLSANWMAAPNYSNENQHLYDAVTALGEEFCPALDVTIPVGKDSLSMRTTWQEDNQDKSVTSPLSVVISSFAPVTDINRVMTPQLQNYTDSRLILIDLGMGQNRLGGSILAQVYDQIGDVAPDIVPDKLKNFFQCIQDLNKQKKILAYHDRSDGGLLTTLAEMSFASRLGLNIDISELSGTALDSLFNEELGAIIQVSVEDSLAVIKQLQSKLGNVIYDIGSSTKTQKFLIVQNDQPIYENSRSELEKLWSGTSYHIQSIRDTAESAREEFEGLADDNDPGLSPNLTFNFTRVHKYNSRPKVAVLREQGVNGQVEMANAFHQAGFEAVDVHLNDLANKKVSLSNFSVLAVCGGFSYGDVLGAGEGWAKSILLNPNLRQEFQDFFERKDTLSLGVCNGCQMLSTLKEIIPGAEHWPQFKKNISEQFESRLVSVKINQTPSVFFKDMAGTIAPIHVAHGEGRAQFDSDSSMATNIQNDLVVAQYVDNYGQTAEKYPANPNGSLQGITSLTTRDGRATILMPHPERGYLTYQYSWHPDDWGKYGPWFKIFQNAREWVESQTKVK